MVSINSSFASGVQGLRNASQGLTRASENIAQAVSSQPTESLNFSNSETQPNSIDLAAELVDMNVSSLQYQASANVIKTADDMLGATIDTKA